VTGLFDKVPVRKQTAVKTSVKCLAKIRRLMQAYALARPAVRFRLHVLKAKSTTGDFIYVPKATSNVEDTVLKVIGKDCAIECDWTAIENDGFAIHAFLPKPTANGPKIANQGAFISIDSRPVSSSRGTIKQMVNALKERLRKAGPSLATVKDPFFCMNITCPPGSYDPNIEPAKDNVMFDDEVVVMSVVDKLLKSYYPEAVVEVEHEELPTLAWRFKQLEYEQVQMSDPTPVSVYEDSVKETNGDHASDPRSDQPRWRSSMYGIDEDDLEFLQEDIPSVLEEGKNTRAAEISNPWTIARMNAPVKSSTTFFNGQLMSPVKGHSEWSLQPSSPSFSIKPNQKPQAELLTPQSSPRMNASTSLLDRELEQSIQRLSQRTLEGRLGDKLDKKEKDQHHHIQSGVLLPEAVDPFPYRSDPQKAPSETVDSILPASKTPWRSYQKQASHLNKSFNASRQVQNETCFGEPIQGSQSWQLSRQQKYNKEGHVPRPIYARDKSLHKPNNWRRQTKDQASHFRGIVERDRPVSQPLFSRAMSVEHLYEDNDTLGNHNLEASMQAYATPSSPLNVLRPTSAGETCPSLVAGRPDEVRTAQGRFRHERLFRNACDIAAYFKAYQDCENGSPDQRVKRIQGLGPHISIAHEITNKPHTQRCRVTDRAQRTTSSQVLLKWTSPGYRIQNFVLPLETSIARIIRSSRKLDMKSNSIEWKHYPGDTYDTLAEPISANRVIQWVIKLDAILHQHCERLPNVNVRSLLHEGIQRSLDARKDEGAIDMVEIVEAPVPMPKANVIEWINGLAPSSSHNEPQALAKAQDEIPVLDMSQLVDIHTRKLSEEGPTPISTSRVEDETEDDMLMDT
jgi:DNA mismatch repair ATPase MutL